MEVKVNELIDGDIGAAAGSEEEQKKLVERLQRKELVKEKKRGERKQKKEKKEANEEERKREEEEVEGLVAQLHNKAGEEKEEDHKLTIELGMRKVVVMKSLLRNEPKSSLCQQAINNEGGRELVCLMDESTWSLIFNWLNM